MAERDGDDSFWINVMRGPEENPTTGYKQHLDRIDSLVHLWHEGHLTVDQKRQAVSEENKRFYGPNCPKRLLWP